jgi:hypothetical protein
MTTLATIVLGLLLIAVALGVANLSRWLRHGRSSVPSAKVVLHIALQVTAIVVWIAFIATGSAVVGWTAFAVITVGQVFGDLLMFASCRARSGETGKIRYGSVGAEVLGFKRPAAALHAAVGALGWFTLLATAVLASI